MCVNTAGLTKQEAEMVTAWLRDQKISTENTRVFKRQHIHTGEEALVTADGADSNANAGSADEVPVYEVRAAAAVSRPDVTHDVNGESWTRLIVPKCEQRYRQMQANRQMHQGLAIVQNYYAVGYFGVFSFGLWQ